MLLDKCNLLFSYAIFQQRRTFQDELRALAPAVRILIDSGAYTNFTGDRRAWVKGERTRPRVTIDAYIDACKTWHDLVWQYVALDEIREPAITWANLQKMLDAGLLPMPVWIETQTDFERVGEYMAITPYLCVAGAPRNNATYTHYMYQQVYKESGGKVKIHALGYTRWPTTFQVPIHSCDSSTYASGSQFGWIPLYTRTQGFVRCRWPELANFRSDADIRRVVDYMLACNVPYAVLSDRDNFKGQAGLTAYMFTVGYLNFMRQAAEYDIWLFMVVSSPAWLDVIASTWATWDGERFDHPTSFALFHELASRRRERSPEYLPLLQALYRRQPLEDDPYVQHQRVRNDAPTP